MWIRSCHFSFMIYGRKINRLGILDMDTLKNIILKNSCNNRVS